MGLNAGNLVLLVEFLFRLAGELGGCMPIPLTTPGAALAHPCAHGISASLHVTPRASPLRGSLRYSENNGRCGTRRKIN